MLQAIYAKVGDNAYQKVSGAHEPRVIAMLLPLYERDYSEVIVLDVKRS